MCWALQFATSGVSRSETKICPGRIVSFPETSCANPLLDPDSAHISHNSSLSTCGISAFGTRGYPAKLTCGRECDRRRIRPSGTGGGPDRPEAALPDAELSIPYDAPCDQPRVAIRAPPHFRPVRHIHLRPKLDLPGAAALICTAETPVARNPGDSRAGDC